MAFVKVFNGQASLSGTTCPTASTAVGQGNTLAIGVTTDTTGGIPTLAVSDGVNTFTQVGATINDATNVQCLALFIAENITGGTRVITFTVGTARTGKQIEVMEFSGRAAVSLDQGPATAGPTTNNAPTTGSFNPSLSGEDVAAFTCITASSAATITAGTNYTLGEDISGTFGIASEYRQSAPTGSQTAAFADSASETWVAGALTLKAAAVGGAVAAFRPMMLSLQKFQRPGSLVLGFPKLDGGLTVQTFNQALDASSVLVTASMQRQTNKGMTGTSVGVTASLVKQANKLVTATSVAVTASLQKQVNKTLSATAVVVTASLLALKVILKALTATTVIVTASIQKQVNKPLTATTIVVMASMQRQVNKLLTATTVVVTASMQALKVILKAMTATTVVVTASMVRQVNKPLVATTLAVTASVQKQVNKKLAATTVAVTASLVALKVILKALTATTVVVTASMVRQTQLHLSATVSLSASIAKRISKSLTATVTVLGSLVATFQGILVGPFAAAVAVADLQATMVAASDASGAAVSAQDATGVVVTAADAAGTSTSAADASGVRVDVTDLLP